MSDLALIVDTETTGLPKGKALSDQPYLVQIAARALDPQLRLRASISMLIVPQDGDGTTLSIPYGATMVHKITDDDVTLYGFYPKVALNMFANMLRRSCMLVAHNLDFDLNVLAAGFQRVGNDAAGTELLNKTTRQHVCTMERARAAMLADGSRDPSKPHGPSLDTAYRWATGDADTGIDGAHDALNDVLACETIFRKLVERGDVSWQPR